MRNKKGTIILEYTYCMLAVMIVLMIFMSFGLLLYQKTMFGIACNQAAEKMATSYKYPCSFDASGVPVIDSYMLGKYRYWGSRGSSIQSNNETKVTSLATSRLTKGSMVPASSEGLDVQMKVIKDDVGRHHYEVTFTKGYKFPFKSALELLGFGDDMTMTKTVYVEGVDIYHYKESVTTSEYILDKLLGDNIINSVVSLFHTVANWFL